MPRVTAKRITSGVMTRLARAATAKTHKVTIIDNCIPGDAPTRALHASVGAATARCHRVAAGGAGVRGRRVTAPGPAPPREEMDGRPAAGRAQGRRTLRPKLYRSAAL